MWSKFKSFLCCKHKYLVVARGVVISLSICVAIFADLQKSVAQTTSIDAHGPTLVSTSEQETVVEIAPSYVPKFQQDRGNTCVFFDIFNVSAAFGQLDYPELSAHVTVGVGIPPDATVQVDVETLESIVFEDIILCPAQYEYLSAPGVEKLPKQSGQEQDSNISKQDIWWPVALAKVEQIGYLRSQRLARIAVTPFRYNPNQNVLVYYPKLRLHIRHSSETSIQRMPVQEPPEIEQLLQKELINYSVARAWRKPFPDYENNKPVNGWIPPRPAIRIGVRQEGIYAVTFQDLVDAGWDPSTIPASHFRLFQDGREVAIRLVDGQGRDLREAFMGPDSVLLFYGWGVDEKYTDVNVYWLTHDKVGGVRMDSVTPPANEVATQTEVYIAEKRLEENLNYVPSVPRREGVDHWYGRRLLAAGFGNSGVQHYQLETSSPSTLTYSATLTAAVVAVTSGKHHLEIEVNGTSIYNGTWEGASDHYIETRFDARLLRDGDNTVTLTLINDAPHQTLDMIYVDWIELRYPRRLIAHNDKLVFESFLGSPQRFILRGFSSGAQVAVYNVTAPERPVQLKTQNDGEVWIFSNETRTKQRYIAVASTAWQRPDYIDPVLSNGMSARGSGADYILITHRTFWDAAQRLAAHRSRQGLRVQVVDVQDIYDQYSYGRISVQAIREFLLNAYLNWPGPAPQYVLLMGDGTYDPRQYRPDSAPTFIPPYLAMVDPDIGETAADNRFVTLIGDDLLPDMHLGRLPVETPEQAAAVVDKIIMYESIPQGASWTQNLTFVADDPADGGGLFRDFSERLAEGSVTPSNLPLIPPGYTKVKLYLGDTCQNGASCREALIEQVNQGTLLVSYIGHASIDFWAAEHIWDVGALDQLHNAERLPIILAMTCLDGSYHMATRGQISLGEAAVRLENSGAIASWSATGLGIATGHDYLEYGFLRAIFHDGVFRLGPATTAGKLNLYLYGPTGKYTDLLDTYVLLGDPATKIPIRNAYGYWQWLPVINVQN